MRETRDTMMVTRITRTASRGDVNSENIEWAEGEVGLYGICDWQFVTMLPSHVPIMHLLYEFAARKGDHEATFVKLSSNCKTLGSDCSECDVAS
jgi:hypothetical protein